MTKAVQFRRGNTAQHLTFTGLEGEITVDTDKDTSVVHNGSNAGGFPLAREDLTNVSTNTITDKGIAKTDLSNVTLSTLTNKGLAKNDMTNVTVNNITVLGIAKNDLSNLTAGADATDTTKGVVELATNLETITGTDTTKATTPAGVKAAITTIASLPRNYITGLVISNAADAYHDITISDGECRDSSNSKDIYLTSTITKQIDATWGEGNNQGGLPSTLSLQANTTYHVFVISKADGTVDAGFDTSVTASNLLAAASNYLYYRRVGSILTNSSSAIIGFAQIGDEFYYNTIIEDYSTTSNIPTTATDLTLSTPLGIKTKPKINLLYVDTNQKQVYFIDKNSGVIIQVGDTSSSGQRNSEVFEAFYTNTNATIQHYSSSSTAANYKIKTYGYTDQR